MEIASRVILLLLLPLFNFVVAQNASRGAQEFHVGGILDLETMVGKIARTSISLAMEDFYAVHQNYSTKLVLHIRDSMRDDVRAASQAINLLEDYNVEAIVGPQKSSQAVFISKLGNKSHVPVISFTATSPSLSSKSHPYFVRATLNDSAQLNCIASIVKTYGWRKVVTIYEDTEYGRGIIPYLVDVLEDIDAHVPYQSVIPPSATSEQITLELYKLMTMQTTVFVVHMSFTMASRVFIKAKEVGMMNKGYAWIMTDGVTNLIDSLNPSVLKSLSGILGVKFYVPKSTKLDDFTTRWNKRFQADNPTDLPLKLSTFGLWSYDTIRLVAEAAEKVGLTNATFTKPGVTRNSTSLETLKTSGNGPKLLQEILQNQFEGLSGNFDVSDRQLQISTFQIINVVGKGWREIGFWTAQNGISRQLNKSRPATALSGSARDLYPVIWPGESKEVPRGSQIPVRGKKLQVGVCTSGYPEFMKVEKDYITGATKASGFSVDVFEEAVKKLPYALPYEYVIFSTTDDRSSEDYNDFVYQVYLKIYDIVIGDITIRYNRTFYVDFTLPYTESGIAMIVPVRDSINRNTWIFLKPLAPGMWFGSVVFFIYTGVVVLILEFLGNNKNVRGPIPSQLGIMIFFSIFEGKELVQRFLSRIVLIVWLVFLMVLTSSYTASLTSMLTVQQLQPTVTDVHELLQSGECVGYQRGSYVKGLLEELGFDRLKIKPYDPDDFHEALSRGSNNGGIAALVHEVPYIKLFLSNHCKGYTMVGPIYKAAGFGYALSKGNPLLRDISNAILNVTGGDTMIQIEKKWIGDQNNCQNVGPLTGSSTLTFANFRGLFILTGVASTSSLLIALIIYFYKKKHKTTKIMLDNTNLPEENGINEENSELQEGNQDSTGVEQNTQRAGQEENGLEQQTSLEMAAETSIVMSRNGSTVISRGKRTTGLQVELM
ncbi:glutamate receptor 2.8-like [Hordeum vulgare subsp. vulgare]|uniref:glutamate receptor 2.8-like n=1 Tax=Hordeum vulgare subsp. vulgare TaxID=112509 RepID=UPI001D1A36BE|nr:glutamate receptor 2.8-like [Hordeum vulgare subsp. vulgare]